jgi:hypothetical protein
MRDLKKKGLKLACWHEEKRNKEPDQGFAYEKLAVMYSGSILDRRAQEEFNKQEETANIDYKTLVRARKCLADEMTKRSEEIHGNLPVSSIEDAITSVKRANVERRDIGVNNLETYLLKLWKEDPSYIITAGEYIKVRDHFSKNYPKSAAVELIDKIGSEGYFTLHIPELVDIASRIQSQGDYEFEVRQASLDGGHPNQVKAREFILALVNGAEPTE